MPALVEKARIQIAMGDWDEAVTATLEIVLSKDSRDMDALLLLCVKLLAQDGALNAAALRAADLFVVWHSLLVLKVGDIFLSPFYGFCYLL